MFALPKLPYEFTALEPHIDAKTMEIHYTKHHQTYVDKLNAALDQFPDLNNKPVEELLQTISELPEVVRDAVRNHGGGHANHSLFWTILSTKGSSDPSGAMAQTLDAAFGSFKEMQDRFNNTATGRFGSGWTWLVVKQDRTMDIYSTANQDSPLMHGDTPILGLDVWEHAYYLNYQNRRPEYISAFWNIVDWTEVQHRYETAAGK